MDDSARSTFAEVGAFVVCPLLCVRYRVYCVFFDIFVYESKRVDVVKVSDEKRSVPKSVKRSAARRRRDR